MVKKSPLKIPEARQIAGQSFGATLVRSRIIQRISQVALAERLEVSKQYLCDIENGRRLVSTTQAVRFAKILQHPEKDFVRLALQDAVVAADLPFIIAVR